MEQTSLSRRLLEVKLEDYKYNSSLLPVKGSILRRSFANVLGNFAGEIVNSYNELFSNLENNYSLIEMQNLVGRDVDNRSKVKIKLPLIKKPLKSRICGLVGMNYSGFFDNEVELYSSLREDLQGDNFEDVVEASNDLGKRESQKYERILEKKRQAIYDFGILMGFVDDDQRLDSLKENMPKKMGNYFEKVISSHKRGILGVTSPLPIKSFSKSIRDNLYSDTISHAIQEGIGKDSGFVLPEKSVYNQIVEQVKLASNNFSSQKGSLDKKLKVAISVPSAMYLAGLMNAYAGDFGDTDGEALIGISTVVGCGLTTTGGIEGIKLAAKLSTVTLLLGTTFSPS